MDTAHKSDIIQFIGVLNLATAVSTIGIATLDAIFTDSSYAGNAPAFVAAAGFGYEALRNFKHGEFDGRGYLLAAATLIPSGLIEFVQGYPESIVPSNPFDILKMASGIGAAVGSAVFAPKANQLYSAIGSGVSRLFNHNSESR